MAGASNKARGQAAEDIAAAYLESLGYLILERNYRSKLGELDIVALDRNTVVFVEVKCRRDAAFGLEAVDAAKQRRLARLAAEYSYLRPMPGADFRFDVVAVVGSDKTAASCVHVKDAFDGVFEY